MTPSMKPPVVGLAEAARMCGVSVSTIRRKRGELSEYGAAQTAKGWQIPIPALIATGLMENTTPPDEAPPSKAPDTLNDAPAQRGGDTLQAELEALRSQLVEAERRAAVAEAVAAERERIIQVQQASLRMLEVGKPLPSGQGVGGDGFSPLGQTSTQGFQGPRTPDASPAEPASAFAGAPQGAPFWRRLMGRR